jgi:hypothetical protein
VFEGARPGIAISQEMSALDLPVREVFDPATGEAIGHVPAGSAGAALRAV